MVSGLILKFLIHLELIFVYSVRQWSSSILLYVAVQFFLTPFTDGLVLSPWYILASSVTDGLMQMCGLISELSILFH